MSASRRLQKCLEEHLAAPEGNTEATMRFCQLIVDAKSAQKALKVLKGGLKQPNVTTQIKILNMFGTAVAHAGTHFHNELFTQKWMQRIIDIANTAHPVGRDRVLKLLFEWYKGGFQSNTALANAIATVNTTPTLRSAAEGLRLIAPSGAASTTGRGPSPTQPMLQPLLIPPSALRPMSTSMPNMSPLVPGGAFSFDPQQREGIIRHIIGVLREDEQRLRTGPDAANDARAHCEQATNAVGPDLNPDLANELIAAHKAVGEGLLRHAGMHSDGRPSKSHRRQERESLEQQLRMLRVVRGRAFTPQQKAEAEYLRLQIDASRQRKDQASLGSREQEEEVLRRLRADVQATRQQDEIEYLKHQMEIEARETSFNNNASLVQHTTQPHFINAPPIAQPQTAPPAANNEDVERMRREYEAQMATLQQALHEAKQNEISKDEVDRLKALYEKEMKERKRLYNDLVELKGNIRVYVRVRPIIAADAAVRGTEECCTFPDCESIIVQQGKTRRPFEFDKVFMPSTTQQEIFQDTLPLISSVLDGFNVCIFAYGQTGCGKTYTMEGPPENPGINRRALAELFRLMAERRSTETASVSVSCLEIYNEEIKDLAVDLKHQRKSYTIKTHPTEGQWVENLHSLDVTSPEEVFALLEHAKRNRTEGQTNMNEHSSRSHMILYIVVRIDNKQTNTRTVGKLSLIDLAGSERVGRSGAAGQALKEAQHINKSLSALGDVIAALGQKQKHVPYRNSQLTHLLQDSLGGSAKTLMFANISPLAADVTESLSTLGFASRARGVELGRAKKNAS